MNRREFLYSGLAGGIGLTMGDLFRLKAEESPGINATAESLIHIFLPGGIAHQETWDPKPLSPIEYRGTVGSISTALPGVYFSQHLQKTAKIADKLTICRSVTHGEAAHERGTHNMFTGYKPSPAVKYPSIGSIVSHELGSRNNLPAYVCIPNSPNEFAGTGYLSSAYGPFGLGSDPASPSFQVRDLNMSNTITPAVFDRRKSLLSVVDSHFKTLEQSDAVAAMDKFQQQAYGLVSSQQAREAFELSKEPEAIKEMYGKNEAGQRFLMARRLVERGVRLVSVVFGGWDMHQGIADGMGRQLPQFDQAFAGLITDLEQRGMLDKTLVMVSSEFGRTPKINKDAGRDHWPHAMSILMAGGGCPRGAVVGATDAKGYAASEAVYRPEDFAASLYWKMGIDPNQVLHTNTGRPVQLVNNGRRIREIFTA